MNNLAWIATVEVRAILALQKKIENSGIQSSWERKSLVKVGEKSDAKSDACAARFAIVNRRFSGTICRQWHSSHDLQEAIFERRVFCCAAANAAFFIGTYDGLLIRPHWW
ncbi:MAG: hypothetical protein CMJ78_12115 [Planctomycetaceae bacterium]|nr:hypothetical protein [Planctomycetaceae bacterium]